MPIDMDKLKKDTDIAIEDSANATDAKFSSKISLITKMTDAEVKELFPEPADAEKLAELMKIVQSAQDRNTKINKIVSNAEEFGGIVLTLLTKFS
ncbi:MAG: hypothetical protein GQ474_07050 [Sulfurimonas sp.]|nr:hypothetical protein [Sulfurimonas sp.]